MFRKFVMILCIMHALCICAYADTEVETIDDTTVTQGHEIVNFTEVMEPNGENVFADTESEVVPFEVMSREMHLEELNLRLSQKQNLKKPEEIVPMMKGSPRVVYNNVSEYTNFICTYDLNDEQLKIVNRILMNGTTIQSLVQVYEFWLTTDYDFSMVEQICALEDKYFSEYWYESAFNKITNYVHGELDGTQLREYQEAGISTDQILAANVMCRRKGQNICYILDEVLAGNTIEAQAECLYGLELEVDGESLFSAVTKLAKNSRSATEVYGRRMSVGVDENFHTAVNDVVSDEISRLNIEVYTPSFKEDIMALKNSKYPLSVQRALMNKGFTPQEIEKSAELVKTNFFEAAKHARETLINEN